MNDPDFQIVADPFSAGNTETLYSQYMEYQQRNAGQPGSQPEPERTAFQRGYVNYADGATTSSVKPPYLNGPYDLMTLDPDPYGQKTEAWAANLGVNPADIGVGGLMVFGKAFSREELERSDAGRQLLEYARRNREGVRRGFLEAITDVSWSDLPFIGMFAAVGGSIFDAATVSNTMKKLQNGDPVTDEELIKTRLYLAKQEYEAHGSWGALVGDIVRQAPGFMAEMFLTGGVGSAARIGTGVVAARGASALAKKAVGEVAEAGAKEAAERAAGGAVRWLTKSADKRLAQELAEEELGKAVAGKLGKVTGDAFAEGVRSLGKDTTDKITADLAKSMAMRLRMSLASDTGAIFGIGKNAVRKFAGDDALIDAMAESLAKRSMKRAAAKLGATTKYRRFGHALTQKAKDWTVGGILDLGTFGTTRSTVLFGGQNSAGNALVDALGTLLVEAPVRGAMQYGFNLVTTSPLRLSGAVASEQQLALQAAALQTGNRDLMEKAKWISMGLEFMEYASENTGQGFGSLFRSAGLATGVVKPAERAFVGSAGGLILEAPKREHGGFLRSFIRKATGTVDDARHSTADARAKAVLRVVNDEADRIAGGAGAFSRISETEAARIAAGDLTGVTNDALRKFVGDDAGKFVKRAVKEAIDKGELDDTYRTYFRYVMADIMARHDFGPDEALDAFEKMGYDGIVEEMLEERYNDFAQGLFGWDDKNNQGFGAHLRQAFENLFPGWDQLTAEAVGFAIPMVARVASVNAQRWAGTPTEVSRYRAIARSGAEVLSGTPVAEVSVGALVRHYNSEVSRLTNEIDELKGKREQTVTEADAAGIDTTDRAEKRRLLSSIDAQIKEKASMLQAQTDARARTLAANGLPTDVTKLSEEDLARIISSPVISADTKSGDLEKDKLRPDLTSKQAEREGGRRQAFVNGAWELGRAASKKGRGGPGKEGTLKQFTAKAIAKITGIAAAILTAEPALAFRNYASWAMGDEGLDKNTIDDFVRLHDKHYDTARNAIIAERAEAAKGEGGAEEGATYQVSEDEIWQRMEKDYKKAAADLAEKVLVIHGVQMFSQREMLSQAVAETARRNGWTFHADAGTFTRTEDGEERTLTFDGFYTEFQDEVDPLRDDIADATLTLLGQGRGATRAFIRLPSDSPEKARVAMTLAMQMAGFSAAELRTVRVSRGDDVASEVAKSAVRLSYNVLQRVADTADKGGTVDYSAPSEEDIIEIASALRIPVADAITDEERDAVRRKVVDLARQYAAVGRAAPDAIVYEATLPEDDPRVRGLSDRKETVRFTKGSDNKWHSNRTFSIDGTSQYLTFDTEEDIEKAMTTLGLGFSRRHVSNDDVLIVDVGSVETDDGLMLVQQFGFTEEYIERTRRSATNGKSTGGAKYDYSYVHPLFRRNVDGSYVYKTYEEADAQFRREVILAELYSRHGSDVSRYPAKVSEGVTPEAARHRLMKEAKAAHDHVYGENGYITVMNQLLADHNVTTPKSGSLYGFATGSRPVYVTGIGQFTKDARAVIPIDYTKAEDYSSAFAKALLQTAFINRRWLLRSDGNWAKVAGDFAHCVEDAARAALYSPDTSVAQKAALRDVIKNVTVHADNMTIDALCELAVSFPMFMVERDRDTGYSSSPRTIAYQAIAHEVYNKVQFLKFFGLVDLMLGGDGFSIELLSRRERAGVKPAPRGIEYYMALFHGEAGVSLKKAVSEINPCGYDFNGFVHNVNELARKVMKATPEKVEPVTRDSSPFFFFSSIRQAFAVMGDKADGDAVLNLLSALPNAVRQDADLRKTVESKAQEFRGWHENVQARIDELTAEIEKLGNDKKNAGKLDVANQTKAELEAELTELNTQIEKIERELRERKHAEELRKAVEAGGEAGELSKVNVGRETPASKDTVVEPSVETPTEDVEEETEEDDEKYRVVVGDRVDDEAVVRLDVGTDGTISVKEIPVTVTDLDDTSRLFAASVVRAVIDAVGGAVDTEGNITFDSYLWVVDKLFPTMPYEEKQRIYDVYKTEEADRVRAKKERLAEGTQQEEEADDEGIGTDADRGFGDKALAAYQDETLAQFLKLAAFAMPTAGRNLQAFLNNVRDRLEAVHAEVEVKRLAGGPNWKPSTRDRAVEAARRLMNPRALLYIDTKENRELASKIEALDRVAADTTKSDRERKSARSSADVLRFKLYSSTSAADREAEWRRVMNNIDSGVDGLTYDRLINGLISPESPSGSGDPACRNMAFLLAFIKGLSKPMRLRLMNLCASSATSTRTRITNRTEKHEIEEAKPVAEYNAEVEAAGGDPLAVSKVKVTTVAETFLELDTKLDVDRLTPSTAMSDSFLPLTQMTKDDIAKRVREVEGRYKAAVEAGEFRTLDIERYERDDAAKRKKCSKATDVLEHNMKVLTRVLSPLFGAETAVMQVLSSGGFALMLDDMCNYVMRGMGNGAQLTVAQGALLQAAIDSSPNFFEKGMVNPRFVLSKDEVPEAPLYSQLMSAVKAIMADATPLDGETPRETRIRREHSATQICLTAFTVGLNRNDTMKVASRTAKVKPSWDWLMNMFIAAQPVTVTPAELLPDREVKTMSSVAVSSRGVIAGIQRWMDLPLSDRNGFAYIAKNLLGGRAGDRLRSMSNVEFLRDVLPMCRQTMTWPDAYHTPILAKNISRSYTPNEVYKALQNRFIKRTLKNESLVAGPAVINTGNRWYYQLFAGDHSSATLIQFPNTRLKPGDGSMTLGVELDKNGDPTAMFKKVSDRVSHMIGMEMIAKDPKRSSLMSNDAPGVALCGTRLANDGAVERGESRVHLIFNFSTDFLEAGGDAKKQEAMKGTVIGRGYGYEQSRLTAGDPLSRVIKAHIMSSSGHMLSFFKGLVSVVGGPRNGQFSKGTIERVLADYLDTFRKGDGKADITTDTALDGDAYKVGHGRSATAGVEYDGPEGTTHVSLFQYISDKLARANIPAGGLDLDALDAILGDNAVAPDGANADDYRLGTFTWVDEAGRKSRVTIADLMGARNPDGTTASDSGIVVRVVQGKMGDQSGYLVDFSYVDNSLQAYTVANVSHTANDEAGRMPRNYVTDALTLASGLIKSGQVEGSVRDSIKDILEQLANWGIVAATVASDSTSVAAIRNEGASESLQALLEKGESPEGLNAEQQVAYDLFKRLTKLLSFPMNKVDCALVSGGAVYDSKRGVVVDHSSDPFLRLMHQGSRVYSKAEMSWRGVPRSLGLGQINVTDDAFRYGWHLDRKAFAETYDGVEGLDAGDLEKLPARTLCEILQSLFEEVHDADARVEGLFRAGKEKQEELKKALKEARTLRDRLTRCFIDHNGQRVSDLKCHFEQRERHLSTRKLDDKEAEEASKYHNQYRYSVCFDDLFIAGAGNKRVFDRSAFFFGNPGYRLDPSTCETPVSGLDHMAADQDPVFLAGTTFGFPRTPSYNGSMWAQTMRAFSPVTTDVAEDGAIIPGRDAYVAPDPQSMYILGCDNDGDKAQCYMFRGNPMTGTTSYQLLRAPTEETIDGVVSVDLTSDSYFNDPELRKRYLYELVEEGVLMPPMKRADDAVSAYRVSQKTRGRVSNQFVQSLFDLSHWLPCSNEEAEKNFADTEFARPTKPQPLGKGAMERLIKVADRRANFLEESTLEDSWTGANVMTSSRSADRARGMAVSLAMVLHFAQMSGRFDDTLFRGWPEEGVARFKAWIDFIYHIDGISNATFDDIKEQICLRLGWTNGMLDTLIVDIMTHGGKTPTTDEEFLEALMAFTSSVSGVREKIVNGVYTYEQGPRGSRYYMLNTSNPADDDKEGTEMKGWVRRFFRPLAKRKKAAEAKARGKDYTPSGVFKGDVEGFFGFGYRYNKKGVLVLVRGDRDTDVDPRVTEFLNAVDNVVTNSEEYLHSRDEDARDGMISRAYRSIVSAISKRRGVNAGSGYVYWLFTEGALKTHEGSVQQEVTDFMKWLRGTIALGEARQVANAVNFTKADPGDAGKTTRQFDNLATFDMIMKKGSNGDTDVQSLVDRAFYTMSMSTRLAYSAGSLATIPARAGLAAGLRGEAIIRTAETVQEAGVLSQEARDLVIALFAGDALIPSYQLKQIQDNLQTLPYFIATLRRMKPVIAGSNLLYGSFDEQWGMMNKLACQEGTFGLLASISSVFRVMYYLSSTDLTPQDCSAFYLLNGVNQRAWDKTFGQYDPETGGEVRTPVYSKNGLEIARITPTYAEGDSMGRQLARLLVAQAAGFTNGHQGNLDTRKRHDGLRKRNAELANTGIDTFCLSADVIEKLIKFSGNEQNVSPEVMKDVLRLREVFENLPEGAVIAPSTFWRQLLPLYAALTQRATAAMNPMSLMPDYYKEISDEQAFLFSGVLEPWGRPARPGLSVWDAACGTDIAPLAAGKIDGGDADAVVLLTEVNQTEKNKIIADLVNLDEKEREKVRTNLSDNKGLRETREKLRPNEDNPHEESTSHLLDVLSPTGLVKSLHKFTLDMAGTQTNGVQIQPPSAPSTDEERVDAGILDPRTRKIVSATRALVAHWATVEYRGGNTFVIRSKGGLNGAGAMHFGMGNGTAAAITVHVGRDPSVNAAVDFDVNSAAFAASFCEQTKGLLGLDVEDFMNLTYEERKALVTRYLAGGGSLVDSNFSLSKPSWTISAEGLRVLSGQIYVGDSTVGSFYHEYFHSMIGMFRTMGLFTDADVKAFVKRYGKPRRGVDELFDEERAAEEFREYVEHLNSGETAYKNVKVPYVKRGKREKGKLRKGERDSKVEADKGVATVFKRLYNACKAFLNAITEVVDNIAAGFRHSEATSSTFLFDMVITGYAAESVERAQEYEDALVVRRGIAADLQKAGASEESVLREYEKSRLASAKDEKERAEIQRQIDAYRAEQGRKTTAQKTFIGEGGTLREAQEKAEAASYERLGKIVEGMKEEKADPMEGYVIPTGSLEASAHSVLIEELIDFTHPARNAAVKQLLRLILDARGRKAHDKRTKMARIVAGRPTGPQLTAEDTIRMKVGVALAKDPMAAHIGPDVYAPVFSLGRAIANEIAGKGTDVERNILDAVAQRMPQTQKLLGEARIRGFALDYSILKDKVERVENIAHTAVQTYLRLNGTINEEELAKLPERERNAKRQQLNRLQNRAYLALLSARGDGRKPGLRGIAAKSSATKTQAYGVAEGKSVSAKHGLSAADYVGFLMACGQQRPQDYVTALKARVASARATALRANGGDEGARLPKVTAHILKALEKFDGFDVTTMLADPTAWNAMCDEFFPSVFRGLIRGPYNGMTRAFGPYTMAAEAVDEIAEENQKLYQLGGADSKGDEIVQQLLADVADTMYAVAASVKFYRELGIQPGTYTHQEILTKESRPPVSEEEILNALHIGASALQDESDIVRRDLQDSFVLTNIDKWLEATLPRILGNDDIKETMMRGSREFRGCISTMTNDVNFLMMFFGISDPENRKLLELVVDKSHFEMHDGGWTAVDWDALEDHEGDSEEEKTRKAEARKRFTRIGFNRAGGVLGKRDDIAFDLNEYRLMDLLMKVAAVKASGGTRFVTGVDGIRFYSDGGGIPSRESILPRDLRDAGYTFNDLYDPEKVKKIYDRYNTNASSREIPPFIMALWRIGHQLPECVWSKDDGKGNMNLYRRFVAAVGTALDELETAAAAHLDLTQTLMTPAQCNDYILRTLQTAGFIVAQEAERQEEKSLYASLVDVPLTSEGVLTFDIGEFDTMYRKSSAREKLAKAGRDIPVGEDGVPDPTIPSGKSTRSMLDLDYIVEMLMRDWNRLRDKVKEHPWLTKGDGAMFNNFDTPLPFFQGTGMFMYHANRLARDTKTEQTVKLGKHEATFLDMCGNPALQTRPVSDVSVPMLLMLHDYYNTQETGYELRDAIMNGKYAKGSRAAGVTGLELAPDSTFLDVAAAVYRKQVDMRLRALEGRSVESFVDGNDAITRMIAAWENSGRGENVTLAGGMGLTDEQMYRLHGVLPANMQIGHKMLVAAKNVTNALYSRSVLINMMFTKGYEGNPVYYLNPAVFAVDSGGVPDSVWASAAKWWVSRNKGLKYDPRLSGVENARSIYAILSTRAKTGMINGRKFQTLSGDELQDHASIDGVLCQADDPSDESKSKLAKLAGRNILTLDGGTALGYAKHFFQTTRVPNGAKLAWMDHTLAWMKALNVSCSFFFPIATKWESPVAAVGTMATFFSNVAPDFARKHHKGINAIQQALTLGLSTKLGGMPADWLNENFIGFKDIIEMMDTNDPFLADLIMWAESLGISMSTTLHNPAEEGRGYVERDIKRFSDAIRSRVGGEAAAAIGATLEAIALRSGEKAFTYALNATKLAVTCQIAMKLRAQAMRTHRAFDPIRDLAKYAAYIDSEIGGVDPLRYAWAHPRMQQLLSRTLFSWQWTRTAWEAGGGPILEDLIFGGHTLNKETRRYILGRWLRMYGTVMIGIPMLAQLAIKGLALAFGRDDEDDKWFTWENEEKVGMSAYDITPLMKVCAAHEPVARVISGALAGLYGGMKLGWFGAIGGALIGAAKAPVYSGNDESNRTTKNRRYYMHFGKQGWEFFRWFDSPGQQLLSKQNMFLQRLEEGLFGRSLSYLERAQPWEDQSAVERWIYPTSDSAWANMLKAFMPFTISGMSTFGDAGFLPAFGPVQMGTSQTSLIKRMEKRMSAWANNERAAYPFAGKHGKSRGTEVQHGVLGDLYEEARRNGFAVPEELAMRAIGKITPRIYGQLFEELDKDSFDDIDQKAVRRLIRKIQRLGGTYKTAEASFKKRMKTMGINFDKLPQERRDMFTLPTKAAFTNPFDDGYDVAMPVDY